MCTRPSAGSAATTGNNSMWVLVGGVWFLGKGGKGRSAGCDPTLHKRGSCVCTACHPASPASPTHSHTHLRALLSLFTLLALLPCRLVYTRISCGKLYVRHKRSIDTVKHVCSRCQGRLLYLGKFKWVLEGTGRCGVAGGSTFVLLKAVQLNFKIVKMSACKYILSSPVCLA